MISKNFGISRDRKLACSCGCGFVLLDPTCFVVLELVREHFGKPVIITSSSRCVEYNRRIGSADTSQHVAGKAVDFRIVGIAPREIYDYIDGLFPKNFGLGLYEGKNFVHFDSRIKRARW